MTGPRPAPRAACSTTATNKDVLAHLLANGFRGKAKLISSTRLDSGADYVRKVHRAAPRATAPIDEDYTLGEQVQYSDI